jgi:hypothetical protein
MNGIFRFDLTVPVTENKVAKKLGSEWDTSQKVWYYNGDYRFVRKALMAWDPRVYLNVPYDEKDDAKYRFYCAWDSQRKKWFLHANNMHQNIDWEGLKRWVPPCKSYTPSTLRSGQNVEIHGLKEDVCLNGTRCRLESYNQKSGRWDVVLLHNGYKISVHRKNLTPILGSSESKKLHATPMAMKEKPKKPPPPTAQRPVSSSSLASFPHSSARAGNAKEAALLRISDLMTVQQLQEECRHRGTIKGFSNKNKSWLLDQLVVGSVWQSAPQTTGSNLKTDTTSNRSSQQKKKRGDPAPANRGNKRLKTERCERSGNHDSPYLYDQLGFYGYRVEMNRRSEEDGDY